MKYNIYMINRPKYIEKLNSWRDKNIIKILTGMRRVGKSTILEMYKNSLINQGVSTEQIIYLNLEDLSNRYIDTYIKLYDYILSKMTNNRMNYIFIDEVQNIDQFEKAIDSLYLKSNVDIYLTGSNAKFLSSEIGTILTGRYIEINVLPFSFKEYVSAQSDKSKKLITKEELFNNYITNGSLPYVFTLDNDIDKINSYYDNIYATVYEKDILTKINIHNNDALYKIASYMFDNISNYTSIRKIANALNTGGSKISEPTVDTYVNALVNSYLFYKTNRYDVKGKNILLTQNKYYTVDIGIRNYVITSNVRDIGRIYENIVYLELINRGYKVYIGKVGEYEVDFVAKSAEDTIYYQVTNSILDENTFEREIRPLKLIKDSNSKYIITTDNVPRNNYDGIKCMNIIDFLLYK